MTKRTIFKIIGYYVLLVGGMFLILVGVNWYMLKQEAARIGMARPNFPYTKYSQDELNKMYPQYPNENVPTTQTPEETYAKFIAALKAGNIDGAMTLFTQRKYKEYFDAFQKSKQEKKINELATKLDKKLILDSKLDTFAIYKVENENNKNYIVEFVKDIDGVWKIDSL